MYNKYVNNNERDNMYNKKEIYQKDELNFIMNERKSEELVSKSLIYGIKKTILSDYNHINESSNTNDFRIGLNKNILTNNKIYDCFYLFPNIGEINSKTHTNIINEKRVEIFNNKNDINDIQFFPIDFIACGSNLSLISENKYYKKIRIRNIFWNIFQTIDSSNYNLNEILSIVPNKDIYIYKKIKLQINFELHSQIRNNDLPYKNNNIKQVTPANTCLYPISSIEISNLNGSNFHYIDIDLNPNFNIECALLCIRVSVPISQMGILEGFNKNNSLCYGHIPFSQLILNFDYEIF